MKYIEELVPGSCFVLNNKHFLLTIDFKSNNKKLCYSLNDGSPLWLNGDSIVDSIEIYTMDEKILVTSLQKLSGLLCKHYAKQAILLIDEYDVPLDKAFQNGYYREMVTLLRGIFGNALKSNPFLKFAVLTGCLRVSKESIFMGASPWS